MLYIKYCYLQYILYIKLIFFLLPPHIPQVFTWKFFLTLVIIIHDYHPLPQKTEARRIPSLQASISSETASKDFKVKISFHEVSSQISGHETLVYVLDMILNEWFMLINLKYFQYFSVNAYHISNIQTIHCKWFRMSSKK